jgi:hypothetical protein
MHRGVDRALAPTPELLPEEDVAGEVETEDRRDPDKPREPDSDPDDDPHRIERQPPHPLPGSAQAEHERDRDAEGGNDVDRLGVEVVLIDDAGPGRHGAESRRYCRRPGRPARSEPFGPKPGDGDRCERDGVVQEDEQPAGAELEALLADVVELLRRQPPVGDEDREPDSSEEPPNDPDLHSAMVALGSAGARVERRGHG